MNLWLDVFGTIAKNIGLLLLSGVRQIYEFPGVQTAIRWALQIVLLPYRIFRRLNPEGHISIMKYAPSNGRWMAALIEMVFIPYKTYLDSTKSLGESEHDEKALALWFSFAWIALIPVVWFLVRIAEDFV